MSFAFIILRQLCISRVNLCLCTLFFIFSTSLIHASINPYFFDRIQDEQRFKHLISELRCPKCQNQNIADSNAPLALDLKNLVYELIIAGRSDQEIMQFMIERYGDFVSYRPPIRPLTWILWFGPFMIGIFITCLVVIKRRHITQPSSAAPLSTQEQAALNQLLHASIPTRTKKIHDQQ